MIIDIRDDLFYKIMELMKNRSNSIYNELKGIEPLSKQDVYRLFDVHDNSFECISKARDSKTQKKKDKIRECIKQLISDDITPTKYQVNKHTNIAFITLNKYFDDILSEVKESKKDSLF